ncbi:MAG: TlpA disulfide reductase family protein [Sciscionella sp.]
MLALGLAGALMLGGCATGHDAVAKGNSFEFVSPGGKTKIFYNAADRKPLPSDIHGESLADPAKQIRLDNYRGKVIVLNIWGSWCGPCRTEAPQLEQVYRQMKSHGVQVVGVDVKEPSRSAPQDFVANHNLSYPSIYDPSGRSLLPLKNYPRSVVPSTIVLDREHRVAAVYLQPLLASDLLPELKKLTTG